MKIKTSIWLTAALCAILGSAPALANESGHVAVPVYMPGQSASVKTAAAATTAKSDSRSSSYSRSVSQGGSAQGVGSQGQSLSIDNHATSPVSTAVAPALTSSNDTCMGSTSLGASAVSFGLSFGSSWTDSNCLMLKNAREMWNMGFKGAALARMCMDDLNKEALEATGVACPVGRRIDRTSSWRGGANNADNAYRN